ncbi:carboxymuconolactone decarboxylase family protein [Novosphingobium sp. Gsoil 351]|uniref:carboxymuconolactone decarboxylase family protein n=1 Tax=Novosphingobium sp. Gsoil 351 TaxID=2675225 RepID=UPI0018A857AE|nr:carboxymuconolactone decarboxylase family protein [Novosphingobium sp. Gsoil 351]
MIEGRVQPLRPEELSDEQRTFLAPFSDAKGRFHNIFGVLVRHLPLLRAWRDFGVYTMQGSRVPPRMREALILRAAANRRCAYEWHHHVRIGRSVGLSDAEIAAIELSEATGDPDLDLAVRAADELERDATVSSSVWKDLCTRLELEGAMDAVFTVGAYTALAMGLNGCGVMIESRGPRTAAGDA